MFAYFSFTFFNVISPFCLWSAFFVTLLQLICNCYLVTVTGAVTANATLTSVTIRVVIISGGFTISVTDKFVSVRVYLQVC